MVAFKTKGTRSKKPLCKSQTKGLGACTVQGCKCSKFVPKTSTDFDFCKTCKHRDVDHRIE